VELNIRSNHKLGGCRIWSFEPNEVRFIGHKMKRQPLLVLKLIIQCWLPKSKNNHQSIAHLGLVWITAALSVDC
jgi:hypothetical protein